METMVRLADNGEWLHAGVRRSRTSGEGALRVKALTQQPYSVITADVHQVESLMRLCAITSLLMHRENHYLASLHPS